MEKLKNYIVTVKNKKMFIENTFSGDEKIKKDGYLYVKKINICLGKIIYENDKYPSEEKIKELIKNVE